MCAPRIYIFIYLLCVCVCVCACACAHVCVCVRQRQKQTDRQREKSSPTNRQRYRKRQRERAERKKTRSDGLSVRVTLACAVRAFVEWHEVAKTVAIVAMVDYVIIRDMTAKKSCTCGKCTCTHIHTGTHTCAHTDTYGKYAHTCSLWRLATHRVARENSFARN